MPDLPRTSAPAVRRAHHLEGVRYEIRGPLARRAQEIERQGYEVIKLNIGNPAQFGFRMPETMRRAMVENLHQADGYSHQKGIFPAREAVVMETQARGIRGVTVEDVLMGNGVSELILMSHGGAPGAGGRGAGPLPRLPAMDGGRRDHGRPPRCTTPAAPRRLRPRPAEVEALITPRTRALVLINPNNPTGAVYPREAVEALVRLAERRGMVLFSDEIYDRILYDGATQHPRRDALRGHAVRHLRRAVEGVPRVRRPRGWLYFSGKKHHATTTWRASSCSPRCASARTCPGSGRCRPRSAGCRASSS